MAWLVGDGKVVASAEVADSFGRRLKGLLGRDELEGAFVLLGARSVHTIGMRFAIDVAWCDADMVVLRTLTLRPYRVTRAVRSARAVIEAPAGAFERWGVAVGDELELKTVNPS